MTSLPRAVAASICLLFATQLHGAERLPARVSWIGNSYPGVPKWVQQDIEALTVTPDGTVFTNVGWDEGGGNVGEYKSGELIRYARHTHGWGMGGGHAVAANSKYLYLSCACANEGGGLKDEATWPAKGLTWFGISRRPRGDISKPAPFPGGKGGKGDTVKESFLPVNEVPEKTVAQIAGLAASETELFVSNPAKAAIQVYDAETMQPRREWKVKECGPIALGKDGELWMLAAGSLVDFDCAAGATLRDLRLPRGFESSSFALSANGEILVNDAASQQILRLAADGGGLKILQRLGSRGGISATDGNGVAGAFSDGRFNDVSAIGCDQDGNVYVAQHGSTGGGSTVLEGYSRDGGLKWRLLGLNFVDMADVDPADDTQVFTKEERLAMRYDQPIGKEWSYAAYTVNPKANPEDPRLHIWSAGAWVRRIAGQRVLFVNDMNGERLQVYRFDPDRAGEQALPSGLFAKTTIREKKSPDWPPHQPEKGAWIWRDTSGDGRFDATEFQPSAEAAPLPSAQGWWVDLNGGVWLATERDGFRYWPAQGLDEKGNPLWDWKTMQTLPHLPEFDQVKRVRYDAEADVLYVAGITAEDKNQHWKPSGPVFARYDGWLHGQRELRWKMVAPYERGAKGHSSCEPMGFDVAGDYLFVPYTGASKETGFATGHVEVFRSADGASVGFMEPSAEIGEIGLQDIRECLRAWRRKDGEYLIFLEDDYKAKIVLYRWKP